MSTWKDRLPGGRADNKRPQDFDTAALAKGETHEREHVKEGPLAKEIAMDHLAENPRYYDMLEKLEKNAADRLGALLRKQANETRFLHGGADAEGAMVKSKLHRMCHMTQTLTDILSDDDQLPGWVQDHISVAHENLAQVFGYLEPAAASDAKTAARAGVRVMKQRLGAGDVAGASRLATTPGVLKPTAAGSQLRHIGGGMEGVSTLVAHPEHGISVRKTYDPQGVSGPEMVANKATVGRALQGNPDVAQFKGEAGTHTGPSHFYEYVRPTPGQAADPGLTARVRSLRPAGMRLHDVHSNNVIGNKVVDYLPVPARGPSGIRPDPVGRADAAEAALAHDVPHAFTNYLNDRRRAGNLMAQAYRGAAPLVQQDSPDWLPKRLGKQAAEQALKDPKGGLTAAGRAHYRRTEGANLKPGVRGPADTPEKMKRKGSFLSRMFGPGGEGPMQTASGEPTRRALSARAWGEPLPKNDADRAALYAKGQRLLDRYKAKKR